MEIKTITNIKPTTLENVKNQIVNTTSGSSKVFTGYIEDLRKRYACPTKYTLLFESNNMKVFHELTYGHTVCYGYDITHNDWYEFSECTFMVHHVEF